MLAATTFGSPPRFLIHSVGSATFLSYSARNVRDCFSSSATTIGLAVTMGITFSAVPPGSRPERSASWITRLASATVNPICWF